MVFGGGGSNDIEIKVRVDAEGAVTVLDDLGNELKRVEGGAESASGGISSFQANIITLQSAVSLAKDAFSILNDTLGSVFDVMARGADVQDIADNFQQLADKAGYSADILVNELNAAFDGTIAKTDLMRQANELLLGGLDPKEFDDLAKAARAFGEATGTSAKEGMEALSDQLLRGNTRFTDRLGLLIDNDAAIKAYAEANKIVGRSLDEIEKKEAIREATIKRVKESTGGMAEVTRDAGDRMARIAATVQDAFDELAKKVAGNEGINKALDTLQDTLSQIDIAVFAEAIAEAGRVIIITADKAIKYFNKALQEIDWAKAIETAKEYATTIVTVVGGAFDILIKAFDAVKLAIKSVMGLDEQFNSAMKRIGDAVEYPIEKIRTFLGLQDKLTPPKYAEHETGWRRIAKAVDEGDEAYFKAQKSAFLLNKGIDAVKDAAVKAIPTTNDLKDSAKFLGDALLKAIDPSRDLSTAIDQNTGKFKDSVGPTKAADDAVKIMTDTIGKAGDALIKTSGIAQIESKKIADSLKPLEDKKIEIPVIISAQRINQSGSDAGESFGSGFQDAFLGSLSGGGAGGAAGGAAGIAAQIGKDLADSIGTAVQDGLQNGFSLDTTKGFVKDFANKIGSKAGVFGQVAAHFISEGLIKGLDHVFGDSEGTKIRKSVDKYFADAFDANRLLVIINGQLEQIKDLDFGGGSFLDPTNSAAAYFEGLSSTAQGAFSAIGLGFSTLLGQGTEFAVGLSQVLAENVGGSLNNLQLLVEATGKTFDELKGAVVEAFFDGKISVLEAQTALNGLAQVAQKGIPDALGATAQAFDNLKIAGGKGGRALIDAMQDVAYEARELGIKDFGALATNIVAAGKYSSEEVSQYFDILKEHGITSVDQLVSATTEQLIGVASQLQAVGGLANNTASQTGGIVDQINNLPDSKTFTLNIKTNLDSNTQAAIKGNVLPSDFGKTSNVGVETR